MKAFSFACRNSTSESKCVVYELCGYIDAHTVIDFEKAVNEAIEKGTSCVILDISGLSYISSAGIGAMMQLTRKLSQLQGDLVLLNPTPKVFTILDGLGFTKIFKIASSEGEAVDLIQGNRAD